MIVRKDAMDNFAATEDDDFDALLNASSLGAPHVVAETEPIPADVRRRLSQAAARPARREAATPPSKQADCAPGDFHGRLATHFDDFVRRLDQPAMVVVVGRTGSGKTALLHSLLREFDHPRPAACSAASPTWRQKVWQRALEDCSHLAWEPWAGLGRGGGALTAWPVGCAGSRCGALLLGSFSWHTLCTPCEDLPLYVKDHLADSEAPPRVLRPAQMTELLLGQATPAAPAALPWPEPRQETPPRTLMLLDCCGQVAKQSRPAAGASFLSRLEQPAWRGAGYGPLFTPRSSHGPASLHAVFSAVLADLYGGHLPPPSPHADTRRWHALRSRVKAWSLRAGDASSNGYWDACWRQEKGANTSPTSARLLLVYFAGHGRSTDCFAQRSGERAPTWPELMWTEQADDGAIEHAMLSMTVHQKGGREAEVPVRVTYRSGDPYAVEAVFYRGDPGDEVVWSFARDLLVDGLQHSGGEGDVTVWTPPDPPTRHAERRTFIHLSSPEGTALLSAPHVQLKRFVDKTLLLVAAGSEHQRFGSALDRLESELDELTCPGFGD